jgi:hypothetical protein
MMCVCHLSSPARAEQAHDPVVDQLMAQVCPRTVLEGISV